MLYFVFQKGGAHWLTYLDSFGTCWSMSTILKVYPTNQQRVGSYPDLTIRLIGEECVGFIDGTSLADITS